MTRPAQDIVVTFRPRPACGMCGHRRLRCLGHLAETLAARLRQKASPPDAFAIEAQPADGAELVRTLLETTPPPWNSPTVCVGSSRAGSLIAPGAHLRADLSLAPRAEPRHSSPGRAVAGAWPTG